MKGHACSELQSNSRTSYFGGKDHQIEQQDREERQKEEIETEPLTDTIRDSVTAYCGKAASHFNKEDDADRPEHYCPDQLKAECRSRLGRRCQ